MVARYDRLMQSRPPLLVVVSGAPASGKTTLATRLADDLRLLFIGKDALKEAICDAIGLPADVAASMRAGSAAFSAAFTLARETLAAGHGVVLEGNFRRGVAEPELAPVVAVGDACLIHCAAKGDVVASRYRERSAAGFRHPAHRDDERAPALDADLESGRFLPLELGIPVMVVATDDGLQPEYHAILEFAAHARQPIA
jgi:predicted kinase